MLSIPRSVAAEGSRAPAGIPGPPVLPSRSTESRRRQERPCQWGPGKVGGEDVGGLTGSPGEDTVRPDGASSGEQGDAHARRPPSGLSGAPEPHRVRALWWAAASLPVQLGWGCWGGQARRVSVVSVWPDHSLLVLRAAFNPTWLLGFTGWPFAVGPDVGHVSLLME